MLLVICILYFRLEARYSFILNGADEEPCILSGYCLKNEWRQQPACQSIKLDVHGFTVLK